MKALVCVLFFMALFSKTFAKHLLNSQIDSILDAGVKQELMVHRRVKLLYNYLEEINKDNDSITFENAYANLKKKLDFRNKYEELTCLIANHAKYKFTYQGRYDEALQELEVASWYAMNSQNTGLYSEVVSMQALTYAMVDSLKKAGNLYIKALNLIDYENLMNRFENLSDSERYNLEIYAFTLNNYADLDVKRKDYRAAISKLETAKDIFKKIDNHDAVNLLEVNIAIILSENLGETSKSIKLFRKMYFDIDALTNSDIEKTELCIYIAKAFIRAKEYDSAMVWVEHGENGFSETLDRKTIYQLEFLRSKIYFENDDFSSLIKSANQIISNYSIFINFDDKYEINYMLLQSYINLGMKSLALESSRILDTLMNHELTLKHRQSINKLESKFNQKIMDSHREILEMQRREDRIYTIGGIILTILILLILWTRIRLIKRSNKNFATQNKELMETNSVKNRLIYIITHDIKNPLLIINASLRLAKRDKNNNNLEEMEDMIDAAFYTSAKLKAMVDELINWGLDIENRFSVRIEAVKIGDIVNNITDLYTHTMKHKGVYVENKIPETMYVGSDPSILSLVLRNLIDNAVKFTYNEGTITIFTRLYNETDQVEILVKDEGIGMSQETIESLKTHKNLNSALGTDYEEGTGLGISMSQYFLKKIGVELTIRSIEGQGSTFSFKLPIFRH